MVPGAGDVDGLTERVETGSEDDVLASLQLGVDGGCAHTWLGHIEAVEHIDHLALAHIGVAPGHTLAVVAQCRTEHLVAAVVVTDGCGQRAGGVHRPYLHCFGHLAQACHLGVEAHVQALHGAVVAGLEHQCIASSAKLVIAHCRTYIVDFLSNLCAVVGVCYRSAHWGPKSSLSSESVARVWLPDFMK